MRRLLALLLILILNAQWIGSAAASIHHFHLSSSATNQVTASPAPAGATFTPTAPTVFSSAAQLSLLAPVGQNYLLDLLPPELRPGSTTFLMDAWLEQQSLRQAALRETGQSTFIAGLAYDAESGLSVDSQQRALLYQAAARFATAEGVKLGAALSDAQQTKLTEPLLWYVEEPVTGPDGKTFAALVPKLYLPEGQLGQWANVAGGVIRGQDVTLDAGAGTIDNTGYVVAGNRLAVNAGELVNRARSASWGSYTQGVEGGYIEVSGDRVQPGGFLTAATLDLNATRIQSISGTFLEARQDKTASLQNTLGASFSQSQNIDHTVTQLHVDSGFGLEQLAVMAIGVAVAIMTSGAASEALFWNMAESGLASTTSFATLETLAGAAGGAAGAMAGNATSQVLSTGTLDGGNVLESGLGGAMFGGINGYFGDSWSWERVGANSVAGGVNSKLQGGEFEDGFRFAAATSSARYIYNEVVKYDTTWEKGGDAADKRGFDMPVKGANNIGTAGPVDSYSWWGEGGTISRSANNIPGINAVAGLHDVFQIRLDEWGGNLARNVFNVPGMLPAAGITFMSLFDGIPGMALTNTRTQRKRYMIGQ